MKGGIIMASEKFVSELELISAADLLTNIESTPLDQDRLSIRANIINASNTGASYFIWNHHMRPEIKKELEDAGYIVRPNPLAANPTDQWIIQASQTL